MPGRPSEIDPSARVHPTALIEDGVVIGPRSAVWDHVHVRHDAVIGHDTSIGEKTYIAYGVSIGSWVKVNAMVYVCALVTVEDGVMISAGAIFTNDLFPRAMDRTLAGLETSAVTDETLAASVGRGATVGAGAVIGPGLSLGRYCMVGMGAVVTRDVPPHGLALGNPARLAGFVCACGPRLVSAGAFDVAGPEERWTCRRCGRTYGRDGSAILAVHDPHRGNASLSP